MTETVQKQIEELEKLRTQMRWWKLGATIASLAVVAVSALTIKNSFQGLIVQGPKQEKFVASLNEGLKADVIPMVQSMAGSTFSQLQPEVTKSFEKLNERVPEITQATIDELEKLQNNLPDRAEKIMNETFGTMLQAKEQKIQEMFPEATEEQVEKLIMNLAEQGKEQVRLANEELFSEHQKELFDIIACMNKIKESEAPNIKGVDPTWEMGLLVLDVFRSELEELRPNAAKEAKK